MKRIITLQKPVAKTIQIPGSKSYTNRGLFLATLTGKKVVIKNPLISEDTYAMIGCLRQLGVLVHVREKSIVVDSSEMLKRVQHDKNRKKQLYTLSARLSGTTIRFILGLVCLIPGIKIISGEEGLNKRPIGDLVDALIQLGAEIEYLDKKGYPPVKVLSSKLSPGKVCMRGDVSSQFISSLLMIAPLVGDVEIEILGRQGSKPFIDMTIDSMEKFGVNVINNNYKSYKLYKQNYGTNEYVIEGDYSSACYFFAITALTGSTITVENLNPNSKQADKEFLEILEQMGHTVIYKKNSVTVSGTGIVKPINVNMENCPDQVLTLSVLAAFAKGKTIISGAGSLKIKETNRLAAVKNELKKMGIKTSSTSSILAVFGGSPKPAHIKTYGDHRMAMAFTVAGAKIPGIEIENPEVVNKTFPDFWKKLAEIALPLDKLRVRNDGLCIGSKNIILIGMRGSGKTTVAKLLSKRLKKEFVDIDEMVGKGMQMQIAKIVEKHGWDFFRKKESEITQEYAQLSNAVISTGGGVVLNNKNIEMLKKNGVVVFLKANVQTLLGRIGKDNNRPFLTNKKTRKEEIKQVLKERKNLYEYAADYIVNTDNKSLEQVATEILASCLLAVKNDIL